VKCSGGRGNLDDPLRQVEKDVKLVWERPHAENHFGGLVVVVLGVEWDVVAVRELVVLLLAHMKVGS
jgi:hypothetical protein